MCHAIAAAVETVPFPTDRLAIGLYLADSYVQLDAQRYFDELMVDTAEGQIGKAVLSWEDAEALARSCT